MNTVLVVDDDPQFRALLKGPLESKGLRVLQAGSANAGNKLINHDKVDLLVVDGLLPDLKGPDWIAQLRQKGVTLPIVFVSAFWRDIESFRRLTRVLDVALVTHKPITPAVFADQVAALLGEPELLDEDLLVEDVEPPPLPVDPLVALRDEYARALPGKAIEIGDAVRAAREAGGDAALVAAARVLCHRVHGTAGSYGATDVGETAGLAEDLLVQLEDGSNTSYLWPALERAVTDLSAAAQRASNKAAAPSGGAPVTSLARVLLVNEDPEFCKWIVELGRQQLVEVMVAGNVREALELAHRSRPDCAILDARLDERGDGLISAHLAHALRDLAGGGALPLAFTSVDGRVQNRVAAAHAGASLYLAKPIDGDAFRAAIQQLVAAASQQRPRVLLVDDDAEFAAQAATVLDAEGIAVRHLDDPMRILEVIEEVNPDLLILDALMPGMSGFDTCRMLRTTPRWQDLAVLFVTAQTSLEGRLAAFAAGADDYLQKPIISVELLARVRVRLERARLLRERISTDALSGLLLRRALIDACNARLAEARRHRRSVTLSILDLDAFKEINDRYGHLTGDQVLTSFGRLLAARLRAEDHRGRWGGEEFALVLPGETAETTQGVIDRLRSEFAALPFRGTGGATFRVTFSAGVAVFPDDGNTLEELVTAADRRLYLAKRGGRNRVIRVG